VVAATKSRELFILAVVGISFGAAVGTEALGFSLALGAFVAGLIVSESEYIAASLGIGYLRSVNGNITILARAHDEADVKRLTDAGAELVVWPELEAGVEIARNLAAHLHLDADTMASDARGSED
jgi:hypothetical protein